MRYLTFCFFALLASTAWAQVPFLNRIPVIIGKDTLRNAWAGGLTAPQFSTIDLDGDGLQDIFVYDRADGTAQTYLAAQVAGTRRYRFAPQYIDAFPLGRYSGWCLLHDYDGDGKPDLFRDSLSGMEVFRNTRRNNKLQFRKAYTSLVSRYNDQNGVVALPLYCASSDIPGLTDVDGDGDMDILSWNVLSGSLLEYHRNMAMEELGRKDTLLFSQRSGCWGHFIETYDPESGRYSAALNYNTCNSEYHTEHSGGAVLPLQLNGDSLVDILISDPGADYVLALTNGGTRHSARITGLQDTFPRMQPINLSSFPACYLMDVNGDGINDLIAAPNEPVGSVDVESVWLYINKGSNSSPEFVRVSTSFLQDEMLDVGTGAIPAFLDYNRDGLTDLIIGNEHAYSDRGRSRSFLSLFQNIGKPGKPVFRQVSDDYLGLDSLAVTNGSSAFSPAFADLDGDGDMDMLLGYFNPTRPNGLMYYRNIADKGKPVVFKLVSINYLGIDSLLSYHTAPLLTDVDSDGDVDLVVGEQSGHLIFYENTAGTRQPANFVLRSRTWGKVQVTDAENNLAGNARPAAVLFIAGQDPTLLVGNSSGRLLHYQLNGTAKFDSLGAWQGIHFGSRAAPAVANNLEDSSSITLVVGNSRGGLNHLLIKPEAFQPTVLSVKAGAINVFLLPDGKLVISGASGAELTVKGPSEKIYYKGFISADGNCVMGTVGWPKGEYRVSTIFKGHSQTRAFTLP